MSRFFVFLPLFFLISCASRLPIVEEEVTEISPQTTPYTHAYTLPPRKLAPLIVIDPGHGGEDQGTLSLIKPGYQEKFLTLVTSKMVRDFLQKMGYPVKLTRSEDIFIPLATRAKIANDAGASLFVSVHYNSAPSPDAHGIEVFYYKSETDTKRTNLSKELASFVLDEVILLTRAKSRGVKSGNYAVIRETNIPAILIEGGFLTNKGELEKIKDPEYLKQLAFGIAKGIDAYIQANKP